MKKWSCIVLLLLSLVLVPACGDGDTEPAPSPALSPSPAPAPSPSPTPAPSPDREEEEVKALIVVSSEVIEPESGPVEVHITVKNALPTTIAQGKVTIDFHDYRNNRIDSDSATVTNMGPGETQDFVFVCDASWCDKFHDFEITTKAD